MTASPLDEPRWSAALLREVRGQLRDITSPIELVSAGAQSDKPWLRIVYRTRGDHTELIGRILRLPPEPPEGHFADTPRPAQGAAEHLVATINAPLTSEQRAAVTVDADGISWVEDPSLLRRRDGGPSMSFVSRAEFAKIWEAANPGVAVPDGTLGNIEDQSIAAG